MQVLLKRAVRLGDRDLVKGHHEIPDEHGEGWFFKALVKEGSVVIKDGAATVKAAAPESIASAKVEPQLDLNDEELGKGSKKKRG